MNHAAATTIIDLYFDGELSADRAAMLEAHIETCAICSGRLQALAAYRAHIRASVPRYVAPAELRERVNNLIDAEKWSNADRPARLGARRLPRRWIGYATAAAVSAIVSTGFTAHLMRQTTSAVVGQDALDDHLRALRSNETIAVASSDKHTVRPWFDGKLDFAPPVTDFAKDGFLLLGGRVDYLEGRPAAVLVYRRGRHGVDLFIRPRSSSDSSKVMTKVGFTVRYWTVGDFDYWAVSDVQPAELVQLEKLTRG